MASCVLGLLVSVNSHGASVEVSFTHSCDNPYRVEVGIRNEGDTTLLISPEYLPWSPHSKSITISAYALINNSRVPLRAAYPVVDVFSPPKDIAIPPGKWVRENLDLGWYYDFEKFKSTIIVFTISVPRHMRFNGGRTIDLRGPVLVLTFPKQSFWGKKCPIAATLTGSGSQQLLRGGSG